MLSDQVCFRCRDCFVAGEEIVTTQRTCQLWHKECFVCAECFQPFPDDVFWEFGDKKYCTRDFETLFAPKCAQHSCDNPSGRFVVGKVVKALNRSWHPQCLKCTTCHKVLYELGELYGFKFSRLSDEEPFCKDCYLRIKEKDRGVKFCHQCSGAIEEQWLRYKEKLYHPYHFRCHNNDCKEELTSTAREKDGWLYCLKCAGINFCGLCKKAIKDERSVNALGKHWHVEHFVCKYCEKPFYSQKHLVWNGEPFCEEHYNKLYGSVCFYCNQLAASAGVSLDGGKVRKYCEHHFECFVCSRPLLNDPNQEYLLLDGRPFCTKCTKRFPDDYRAKNFRNKPLETVSIGANASLSGKMLNPFKRSADN